MSVLTLVAMLITAVRPPWWGPRWYRERLGIGSPKPSRSGPVANGVTHQLTNADPESLLARYFDGEPIDRWTAMLLSDFDSGNGPDGQLFLLPTELVFISDKPYLQTTFGETIPMDNPQGGEGVIDTPLSVGAHAYEVATVQLRSELEWRAADGAPLKVFRPAAPFLWIQMRKENQVQPYLVSHPEEAARRISEVFGCPLEDIR